MTRTLDRTLPLPELAKAWGWPQTKLRGLVKQRAIPHLCIRGRIYFELTAVEEWKAAHRQAAEVTEALRSRAAQQRAVFNPDALSAKERWGRDIDLARFTR